MYKLLLKVLFTPLKSRVSGPDVGLFALYLADPGFILGHPMWSPKHHEESFSTEVGVSLNTSVCGLKTKLKSRVFKMAIDFIYLNNENCHFNKYLLSVCQ